MSSVFDSECSSSPEKSTQEHTAAKTIQHQWKKIKATQSNVEAVQSNNNKGHMNQKKKYKLEPVQAPLPDILSWIQGMNKAKQRKHVFPGMRVKVHFYIYMY